MYLSLLILLRNEEIIFSKLVEISNKDSLLEAVSEVRVNDERDVIRIIFCIYDSEGESLGGLLRYTMGNNLILPTVKTIVDKLSIIKNKACSSRSVEKE